MAREYDGSGEWSVLSLGEQHPDIDLGNGTKIQSLGKASLEDYARIMAEASIGISLMESPHPSYPPLEMAAFGVRVITNAYANKDLSSLSGNIHSLPICSPDHIAEKLAALAGTYTEQPVFDGLDEYIDGVDELPALCGDVSNLLKQAKQ